MWLYLYLLSVLCLNVNSANKNELHIYMDNQTLCNQEIIDVKNMHLVRIYSHVHYHDKYFYFSDHHCSITMRIDRRAWMSVEHFESNSSVSFPRCTDGKYAGNDDRLQIIDGYRNGTTLRIICGKSSDKLFDRMPLIPQNSIFTIDWQTKSQSFGFELKFVLYDLAVDGECLNSSQFQCQNRRCIDRSLICTDEDYCGDNSHRNSAERSAHCNMSLQLLKQDFIHLKYIILLVMVPCCCLCIVMCCVKICRKKIKNKQSRRGL